MMIVMSGVAVDRQSRVRGLTAIGLMPGWQRRRRRLMTTTTGWDSILQARRFQGAHPVVRIPGGQLRLRVRRSAQRMTGIMGSCTTGRDPVDRRGTQRRRAIVRDTSTPSTSAHSRSATSSSAMTGRVVRDGQRSRAAHLARRLAVDVGEALGEGGAAVWQEPDPTGPGARCPKF